MERDLLLAAVHRRQQKSLLDLFFESPWRAINEQHALLYVLSAVLAIGGSLLAYYLGLELANIGIMAFVLFVMPPGLFNLYETNRIKRVEAEFPAMLRDISISVKSGMTLRAAVSFAAQGQYGALTPAVRHISNMISWGASFEDALLHFVDKYPTLLIRRTLFTLVEASRMGGELGEILENVALDAEEIQALEKRRSGETRPYIVVCYVSYFVFLAVIIIMSYSFLPMLQEAAEISGGQVAGGVGQFAVSEQDMILYNRLFFHALVIQGLFAGLVTGKLGEGKAVAGLKHSVFFIVVAVIAYTLLL
jgi:flagellar protein FlaJ